MQRCAVFPPSLSSDRSRETLGSILYAEANVDVPSVLAPMLVIEREAGTRGMAGWNRPSAVSTCLPAEAVPGDVRQVIACLDHCE